MAKNESGDHFEDLELLTHGMFKSIFRSYIEDGIVEIANRTPAEIIDSFRDEVAHHFDGSDKLHASLDYKKSLLKRAEAAADDGDDYISIMLYATWVEHFVNSLLDMTLTRQGYSVSTIKSLLREVRLPTKLTALWEIACLPPLPEDAVTLLDKVANNRNYFVHYKWTTAPESEIDSRHKRLRATLLAMPTLIERMEAIEVEQIWSGRKHELMTYLRESLSEQARQVGKFGDYLRGATSEDE